MVIAGIPSGASSWLPARAQARAEGRLAVMRTAHDADGRVEMRGHGDGITPRRI